jgi:purple acid phosphatase-like protein/uncharacterized protein DUF5648
MKRTFTFVAATLLLWTAPMFAQKPMDSANEKAVHITSGPSITNITPTGATINWSTNAPGANHVRYRIAGSNEAWKSAYHSGGGTSHSLQMTGLQPGKTYEWEILTRDGDLRTAGQFQTPTSGTAPDVNASAATPAAPAAPPATGSSSPSIAKVPLYRGVNSLGDHLYSTNAGDVAAGGFKSEGIAGYVASSQTEGTVPLYRLSNSKGDSILTVDANTRGTFQGQGYQDNGVVGYVATSQMAGTQPLYQISSPDGANHFYTASGTEHAQVVSRGWKDEGTVGYIWSQP